MPDHSPNARRQARVMVTCVGSTNALSIIKALREPNEIGVWVLGVDSAPRDLLAGSAFCDRFERVPSFDQREHYVAALAALAEEHRIDWLVPIMDLETIAIGASRQRFAQDILQLSPQTTLELAGDKWASAQWLVEHGFDSPPTRLFNADDAHAGDEIALPALAKPRFGFSSRGIVRLERPTDRSLLSPDSELVIQEVAAGVEFTVDLFGDGERMHCAVPRRRHATKAGQIYQGETVHEPLLIDTAQRIGALLGVRGMFNIQGFLDGDRFWITDLNPRSSGGLPLTTAAGANLPLATLRLALGVDHRATQRFVPTVMSRYWMEVFREPPPTAPATLRRAADVVPVRDLPRERAAFGPAIDLAVRRVLDSGEFIHGPEVLAFEREFASCCGAADAIGVASGSDALVLALRGLRVGPRSEVLAPAHTAPMTIAAIQRTGARPVLVDVHRDSGLIDLDAAAAAKSAATRAIVPVHLYGQCLDPVELDEFARATDLAVVEDAAQAVGAERANQRAGTMGRAAAFSFYPTKNLGAAGDGGAVVTSDPDLAEAIRTLRTYGLRDGEICVAAGSNSRLDAMQAAILRVKLPHLAERTHRRTAIVERYVRAFAGHGILPGSIDATPSVHHLFVLRVRDREQFRSCLEQRGIQTAVHYAPAMHRHAGFADCRRAGPLHEADAWAAECVTLPLFPELRRDEVDRVIDAVLHHAADHRATDS